MQTTGRTGSTMTPNLLATAVKTGTLTVWSYLAFQEYLAVTAGNVLSTLGFGIAALAELFLGLWIARYKLGSGLKSPKGHANPT